MNRRLQVVAVILWLVSLALPTLPAQRGENLIGLELLGKGAIASLMIPFSLFYPGHLLSFASNFLLIREALFALVWPRAERAPSQTVLGLAFLLNACMGLATLGKSDSPTPLAGVLQLPGFYVWLIAFFVLMLARMKGPRPNPSFEQTPDGAAQVKR